MKEKTRSAYSVAGVDIEAQSQGLREVGKLARATFTPGVLSDIGSFGGLFRPDLAGMTEPVLVASADGVGTKLAVARMAGDYSTVGRDLVNHCVNDILVQGARPLFFLDYVGAGVLEPAKMIELVGGVADGCRETAARCSAARPPRCRASISPATTSSSASSSASPIALTFSRARVSQTETCCSDCRRRGCTPTAIRWRGGFCSSSSA
jgi:phosphoribosylformylglycinamidine cyclo-ligase